MGYYSSLQILNTYVYPVWIYRAKQMLHKKKEEKTKTESEMKAKWKEKRKVCCQFSIWYQKYRSQANWQTGNVYGDQMLAMKPLIWPDRRKINRLSIFTTATATPIIIETQTTGNNNNHSFRDPSSMKYIIILFVFSLCCNVSLGRSMDRCPMSK